MSIKAHVHNFMQETTVHGPNHAIGSQHRVGYIYWTIIFFAALVVSSLQAKDLYLQYLSGEIHSSAMPLDVLKDGNDLLKITYCSDDWVDIEKLNKSELSVNEFVYFMTLMPGIVPRQYKISPIMSIYEEFGFQPSPLSIYGRLDGIHTTDYLDGIYDISWELMMDEVIVSFATGAAERMYAGLTHYNTIDYNEIAQRISGFAKKHNLKTIIEFARYFAKQNVTVGQTRQIGDAIAMGRYCRELELEKAQAESCDFRQDSKRLGFQVKYDMMFGFKSNGFELPLLSKHVAIFPMVGLGVVSEEMQTQILDVAYRNTPDLQKLSNFWGIDYGEYQSTAHQVLDTMMTADPILLPFDVDMLITRRANKGQSPCEPNDKHYLPTLYNKWICKQKCSQKAVSDQLRSEYNCTFVGAHAESLDVEVPCGCERQRRSRGKRNQNTVVMCPILRELHNNAKTNQCAIDGAELSSCQAECDTLPACRSVDATIELVESAKIFGPSDEFENDQDEDANYFQSIYGSYDKSQFSTGEMLLHVDMNIRSATKVTEYLVVDDLNLIVGLGGIAGLFTGFSVISLIHCATFLVMTPYTMMKKPRKTQIT